ncbi:hypothetical protein [Lacticaseibacillus daqingensis]|uniref:hypothetical protein n=1 Tax=Lacticaseibacillus daqingensis TaxID=2486014 RepID=UPI000F778A4B|nr:hypothetical protein [Lacticaseibacillus daqingensis]
MMRMKQIQVSKAEWTAWKDYTSAGIESVNDSFEKRRKEYPAFKNKSLELPKDGINEPLGWLSTDFQSAFRRLHPRKAITNAAITQIPDGLSGDWMNADFFLCLANPRASVGEDQMPYDEETWHLIKSNGAANPLAAESGQPKPGYYTTHYLKKIHEKVQQMGTPKVLDRLPLCKIDLVPYRSATFGEVQLTPEAMATLPEVTYGLNVILERIFRHLALGGTAPIFAMRSLPTWRATLSSYLTLLSGKEEAPLPASVRQLLINDNAAVAVKSLLDPYVWRFSNNRSAYVSSRNTKPLIGEASFETLLQCAVGN